MFYKKPNPLSLAFEPTYYFQVNELHCESDKASFPLSQVAYQQENIYVLLCD